jgi:hypothetical protein
VSVHLHIERLVLDGLPLRETDAGRVRAALEAELASLVASGALPHTGYAIDRVRAEPLRLAASHDAAGTGRAIASSVHSALQPAPNRATRGAPAK